MDSDEILRRYGDRVDYGPADLALIGPGDHRRRHLERLVAAASRYSIQAEVIEASHCSSGYQVGDRFLLDVDGNLIPRLCPRRLCVYLISQLAVPVALINERLGEGLAPGDFHFMRRLACPDLGVECLGFGRVMLEVTVVPRSGTK